MAINSYWSFEKELDNFEEYKDSYNIPNHKSNNFIDIDIVRNLIFIYNDGFQSSVEDFIFSAEEFIDMFSKISSLLNFQYNAKDLVRILFDFDNSLVKIKVKDETESYKTFNNLDNYIDNILDILNIDNLNLQEVDDDFQAILFLKEFESWSIEKKVEFIDSYLKMSEYISQLETELNVSRELIKQMFDNNKNEFTN